VLASAAVGWMPGHGPVPMAVVVALCAGASLLAYSTLVVSRKSQPPSP
jgi:hypothetical protein